MILTYSRPNNPAVLLDELMAAMPSLQPVVDPQAPPLAGFSGPIKRPQVYLNSDGLAITLLVPDGTNPASVAAVVNAHTNPAPPTQPDFGTDADDIPLATKIQRVTQLRTFLGASNATLQSNGWPAPVIPIMKTIVWAVLHYIRRNI